MDQASGRSPRHCSSLLAVSHPLHLHRCVLRPGHNSSSQPERAPDVMAPHSSLCSGLSADPSRCWFTSACFLLRLPSAALRSVALLKIKSRQSIKHPLTCSIHSLTLPSSPCNFIFSCCHGNNSSSPPVTYTTLFSWLNYYNANQSDSGLRLSSEAT